MRIHAKKLTEYKFKELHFTSELGTDLTVQLVKNHIWVGGGDTTPRGAYFDPNIPTEEVFCMEVLAFPKVLEASAEAVRDNAVVVISGRVSYKEEEPGKLLADTISDIGAYHPKNVDDSEHACNK